VEQSIPENSVEERLDLVRGWCHAWRRFGMEEFIRSATAIVDQLSSGPDTPASVLLAKGMIADEVGDDAVAERSYRAALELDSDLAFASNNLAMLLVERKEFAEALKYAKRASEHDEALADFHDTLAIVLAGLGKHDLAADALRKAVALEPKNPKWRLGLVRALIDSDQRSDALDELVAIDGVRQEGKRFDPETERRLRELREELGK
jgi:Flp pilus assembly protein TadD